MCDLLRKNYALDSSKMTGRSQETKQANNPNPEKEIRTGGYRLRDPPQQNIGTQPLAQRCERGKLLLARI